MTRFEKWADTPTPDGTTKEASEAEPPHGDGRRSRSTKNQRLISSHMLWKCGMHSYKRKGNCWRQLHQRTSIPYLHRCVLNTVADEQRGHLPKRGRDRDSDTEETHYVSMCTMVEDDNCGLDTDE
eukprot:7787067-Pyramimonas_sp.AAC.1